ncbi:hypothetical protein AGMMS50284_6660 [Clostridia bacterium]|nr:hypothetical protein AGMMS50284_6660 [Clostridia bacterium]
MEILNMFFVILVIVAISVAAIDNKKDIDISTKFIFKYKLHILLVY